MKSLVSNSTALGSIVFAAAVSLGATVLNGAIERCESALETEQRLEMISALDALVITEINKRNDVLRERLETTTEQALADDLRLLDQYRSEGRRHISDAIVEYSESREKISELRSTCSNLDFPLWLTTLLEWAANLFAAVIVFAAGLAFGSRENAKNDRIGTTDA